MAPVRYVTGQVGGLSVRFVIGLSMDAGRKISVLMEGERDTFALHGRLFRFHPLMIKMGENGDWTANPVLCASTK